MIHLDCPLCGVAIWSADAEPDVDACPGCAARVLGAADDPRSAARLAADALGLEVDREALALGLFAIGPDHDLRSVLAITSDRRDRHYRWWVVVGGEDPAATLARAAV